MTAAKHRVTIKGVKDGLVFVLDDTCPFADVVDELRHKMETTHQQILTGPVIRVHVKLGAREVSEEQKEEIRRIIGRRGNLLVQSIQSSEPPGAGARMGGSNIKVMSGIVRSGQTITHDGDLLYLGDVNPGGAIICSGDIYVMGALRGMAHAGMTGNEHAIIAASHLRPTQLRIASVISRPPDEWNVDDEDTYMEFAYIRDGKMEIDKIHRLHRVKSGNNAGNRPEFA